MKTLIVEKADIARRIAEALLALVSEKPDAVIALMPDGIFRDTGDAIKALGGAELSGVRVFSAVQLPSPYSMEAELSENLRDWGVKEENVFFPSDENYDEQIAAMGGIDLALLTLGSNASIGFNEPSVHFDSRTHRQKLTKPSLADRGLPEDMELSGWTMGIKTITEAKQILVAASGDEKADAVFKMLYARTDYAVPAAYLQIPPFVTVIIDKEAGKKL